MHSTPLRPVRADEFLPPVSRWTTIGGGVLIGAVTIATVLAAVVKYNVAVKAPATIRPAGELRLVQATIDGTVEEIAVQPNQLVQQGDVIARLSRTSLESQRLQLQGSLQQQQLQLSQVDAQMRLMSSQIGAETRAIAQAVAVTQAELSRSQRDYRERQTVTQADLTEAEAALNLARSEMQRYEQLVESGAVSQLQLEEKQAATETAQAQVQRAAVALNPIDSTVAIAQGQIEQETARGNATLATLQRERELLAQNQAEQQAQLLRTQHELQQVENDLEKTIVRAVASGIVFQLNLRNSSQVVQTGDVLVEIAPNHTRLMVKARVATQDIDRVEVGQRASLRIAACPFPEYGVLAGQVTAVAPDAVTSPAASSIEPGGRYFDVTIQPEAEALSSPRRQCQLQPGMEADATIISREETFLRFLLRQARLLTAG